MIDNNKRVSCHYLLCHIALQCIHHLLGYENTNTSERVHSSESVIMIETFMRLWNSRTFSAIKNVLGATLGSWNFLSNYSQTWMNLNLEWIFSQNLEILRPAWICGKHNIELGGIRKCFTIVHEKCALKRLNPKTMHANYPMYFKRK